MDSYPRTEDAPPEQPALKMLAHLIEEVSRAIAGMVSTRAQQGGGGADNSEAFL